MLAPWVILWALARFPSTRGPALTFLPTEAPNPGANAQIVGLWKVCDGYSGSNNSSEHRNDNSEVDGSFLEVVPCVLQPRPVVCGYNTGASVRDTDKDRFLDFSRLSTGSSKRKYASTKDRANENARGKIYAIVSQPGGTNQTPLLNVVHPNRNQGCTVNPRYEDGCPRVVPWSKPPSGPRHGLPCAPLNCHSSEHSRG